MTPKQEQFLVETLGEDGATAILRATRKSEALSNVLLPRTLLSWASLVGQYGYQGEVPGIENSFLEFKKTDDSYSGALTIGSDTIPFTNSSVYRLSAHMAIALGLEDINASIRGIDLQKLGKSIDLLVKSRATRKYKQPIEEAEKTELPGMQAKPTLQNAPQEPIAPTKQPKLKQQPKQLPALKVGKSEMGVRCSICGNTQFQDSKFTGCLCFSSLAKSARTVITKEGDAVLTFGSGWTIEGIEVLIEALHQ